MRTAFRLFLVALLVIAGFLAWTNPDEEAFRDFAEEELEELAAHELGDTELGRLLAGVGAGLAGAYIEQITRRRSYLVYSTYTVPLTDREEDEWVFLGIAGRFLELEHPEVLRESSGSEERTVQY